MRRTALAFLAILALGAPLLGQTTHPPGTLLADLGTCDSTREGLLRFVTDGDSATDCNPTGTGDYTVLCQCQETVSETTWAWVAVGTGGGITDLDDIGDAGAAGSVEAAEWAQDWNWTSGSATAAVLDAFKLTWDYPSTVTTDSGDQHLFSLDFPDNAGDATGQIEAMLHIDNQDANDAPLYAILIEDTQPWGSSSIGLPYQDDATTPTLTFGTSGAGFYSPSGTTIRYTNGTADQFVFAGTQFRGASNNAGGVAQATASATVPTLSPRMGNDANSGMGAKGDDQPTLVAGGYEAMTLGEEQYGTSAGDIVWFIPDVTTPPSSNPTGGVLIFSEGDDLYIRDTTGTETNLTTGAATNLNDLGDATAAGSVESAEWAQDWNWTSGSATAAAVDAFTLSWTYPSTVTTDSGNQFLLNLELLDNAGDATGQIEALLRLDNADANDAPLYAIRIDETQPWGSGSILLPVQDDAATPTLAFGDGDTGFYQRIDNVISFAANGSYQFELNGSSLWSENASGPSMTNAGATASVSTFRPNKGDTNTGIGSAGADCVTLIGGAIEGLSVCEGYYTMAAGDISWFIPEATTAPSTNPSGGIILFADGDDLWIRDTTGTSTNLTSGGAAYWEDLANSADTATAYTSNNTAETVTFSFESSFGASQQFLIRQQTGTPTDGTLLDVRAANSNVTVFRAGDGTNGITVSQAGALTSEGSGSITADEVTCTGCVTATEIESAPAISGANIDSFSESKEKTLYDRTNYLAAADDVPDLWIFEKAITVTAVKCISTGGTSVTVTIEDDASNDLTTSCVCTTSLVNCTLTGNTSFAADERADWTTESVSGNVTSATVTIYYDAD
jgi:hypothetical protein